jgi:hypothetical protein
MHRTRLLAGERDLAQALQVNVYQAVGRGILGPGVACPIIEEISNCYPGMGGRLGMKKFEFVSAAAKRAYLALPKEIQYQFGVDLNAKASARKTK